MADGRDNGEDFEFGIAPFLILRYCLAGINHPTLLGIVYLRHGHNIKGGNKMTRENVHFRKLIQTDPTDKRSWIELSCYGFVPAMPQIGTYIFLKEKDLISA